VLLGALEAEVDAFLAELQDRQTVESGGLLAHRGTLFGKEVVIGRSGVGKVYAAMTTQWLIREFNPEAILFTGVAGALNAYFEVGDIVLARDCVQYDMDARGLGFPIGTIPYTEHRFFESDNRLLEHALTAPVQYRMHTGRILTGDRFVTHEQLSHLQSVREELGGDAVEMEGASVAQVCTVHGIPSLIIRTISDKANADSPVDFPRFLPTVAKNSFSVVKHLLERI
jgi:5'-methylthioadenosine/S-adenosylhomocysteine nucleosidase